MSERIAIIDLGTNTFHLLIAEKDGGKTNVLHREKQAVKIGVGGIARGTITDEAIQRGIICLTDFKKTMNAWNVKRTIAFGTSALRDAHNGDAILQKIKQETGIEVKLISGDQEAEYIYYGVRSAMDLGTEKSLIVDIGGGSVEFIIGDYKNIFWRQSFDIGAQRLLEQYQKHDPITTEEINKLEAHFGATLPPLREAYQEFKPETLIGSSGTFDTLSEIYCFRHGIILSEKQSETPLTSQAFGEIYSELISKNRSERQNIPGMIEMRVDMIVVASCLVNFLITQFFMEKIRVSTYSLKEGVLASL